MAYFNRECFFSDGEPSKVRSLGVAALESILKTNLSHFDKAGVIPKRFIHDFYGVDA